MKTSISCGNRATGLSVGAPARASRGSFRSFVSKIARARNNSSRLGSRGGYALLATSPCFVLCFVSFSIPVYKCGTCMHLGIRSAARHSPVFFAIPHQHEGFGGVSPYRLLPPSPLPPPPRRPPQRCVYHTGSHTLLPAFHFRWLG